jgi:CheY-like chemotaxis protein
MTPEDASLPLNERLGEAERSTSERRRGGHGPPTPRRAARSAAASETGRRVLLVVENSPTMRALLSSWLEQEGYTVDARSVTEAAAYFYECLACDIPRPRVDAIVSELQLPGDSGLRLLRYVRLLSSDIPTVLLCVRCTDEWQKQAAQLGADAILQWPLQRWALAATLRHLLQGGPSDGHDLASSLGTLPHDDLRRIGATTFKMGAETSSQGGVCRLTLARRFFVSRFAARRPFFRVWR